MRIKYSQAKIRGILWHSTGKGRVISKPLIWYSQKCRIKLVVLRSFQANVVSSRSVLFLYFLTIW